MCKTVIRLTFTMIAFGLLTTAGYGQILGVYRFDGGGDGTSWDDAANWEQVLDPFGNPISGNPPTPPGPTTSAEIPLPGVVIDNTMPGQTALDVRIGTAGGAGSLNMSGGGLAAGRDLRVGFATNPGSFTLSGGTVTAGDDIDVGVGSLGTMIMSGGTATVADDFNIGPNSTLTLTGGRINIVDRLVMTSNAHLDIEGGEIVAEDDFFIFDVSTVTMEGGLMSTIDKLSMGGATPMGPARLVINAGIMRGNEWTDNSELEFNDPTRFMSVIEINSSGKLQIEQATFPESEAEFLIAEGVHLTTTDPRGLGVQTVIVPEFFGRTDVVFTQVSVIPEPASLVLMGLGALCLMVRRKRA